MLNLTNTLDGYLKNIEILGNTIQDAINLQDIKSVGDKVEGRELYNISIQVDNGNGVTEISKILSPIQLEKVGNVADKIICKDGVWGVEKTIITERLTSNLAWNTRPNNLGVQMFVNSSILNLGVDNRVIMCNTLTVNKGINQDSLDGYNQILAHKNSKYSNNLYVSVANITTIEEFGKWLDDNPTYIKYATTDTPQFTPLPHDQQIKLRTFTGQTNISFLTEIAGQVKGQVPKSLGATINTHTEQISNLNKELDRVKKLEESTVSTVETESNFTTVDATNNGYFEDVKLEGKTLVNLAKTINSTHYVVNNGGSFSNNEFNSAIDGSYCGFIQKDISMYKPNTTYTAIVNIKSNTTSTRIFALNRLGSALSIISTSVLIAEPQQVGTYVFKFVTRESIDDSQKGFNIICNGAYTGQYTVSSVVILEGERTNNPPEYFEGLMSVGQDVEEVSVESVTNNLFKTDGSVHVINKFINDSGIEVDISTHSYIKTFTEVQPFKTYIFNKKIDAIYEYDKDMNFLSRTLRVYTSPFTIQNKKCRYIGLQILNSDLGTNLGAILNGLTLNYGDVVKYGSEHQSNKKSIVYYNPTTETWEKPVLREWDSIEKHSDGKYYYHQRSEEVDYISGDENLTDCITDMNKTVKKISTEKVYECTNIDLMTYSGETNYIINSGAISPKSLLKVHNNISNVVKILQEKVALLENTFIAGLKSVLAGDMYSLATILYPEDFEQNDNIENDIMVIPE